ncbi:hypothetical protein HY095_01330 [Candidatus Micrarchaeota archaeon]|nr:hypothetical protein [Candidatus Micrarchaeota archaeon]
MARRLSGLQRFWEFRVLGELPVERRHDFRLLSRGTRKKIAEDLRLARRGSPAGNNRYAAISGHLLPETAEEIERRAAALPLDEVRVLDAGAGLGAGVALAGEIGGSRVRAFGLAPHHPDSRQVQGNRKPLWALDPRDRRKLEGRWFEGYFEGMEIGKFFDIIHSHHGLEHSFNHALALENMLNSLRKGGVLIVKSGELFHVPYVKSSFSRVPYARVRASTWREYERAAPDEKKNLERSNPALARLAALVRVFEALGAQGFAVPEPSDLGRGLFGFEDVVRIRRVLEGRKRADLKNFYGHPALNKIPLQFGK